MFDFVILITVKNALIDLVGIVVWFIFVWAVDLVNYDRKADKV